MATRKRTTPTPKTTKKTVSSHDVSTERMDVSQSAPATSRAALSRASRRPLFVTLGAIIIIVGLLYLFRDKFIAATVNGQIISKAELVSSLEKQYGQQALDNLITKVVVEQEAKKRNIAISDEEMSAEIEEIEERFSSQQQSLDDVLASQGYTRDDLQDQIRLQLMVEKMVEDKTAVTDEEVTKYITDNKEFMPTGVPAEQQQETAREDLKQEKVNQEAQGLLQELKTNANIKYFSSQPEAPAVVTPQ